MRKDILLKHTQILNWISENQSKAFIARQLSCKIDTLDGYLRRMNIQYSGNKNGKGRPSNSYIPAMEYILTKHPKASIIRQKFLKEKIKEYRCEICKLSDWFGKKIPLELDHIDGNHFNNSFENLRIICSNCHALTDTNSGKNKGKYSGS